MSQFTGVETPAVRAVGAETADHAAKAGPVAGEQRLIAIDATRGLALLGILLVNVQAFGEAFGMFVMPRPESSDPLTVACFYFVKIFCEGKFYPLFSLLFGIGLILQMGSVDRAGRSFVKIYLRRLAILGMLGLAHGLLLWYGDILFVYAFAGLALMLAARLRGKVLLGIGIGLVAATTLLGGALTGLSMFNAAEAHRQSDASQASPPAAASSNDATEADGQESTTPVNRLLKGFESGKIKGDPAHPVWIRVERQAYREGPWWQSFAFRAVTWAFYMIFCVLVFGWHVTGMFFIGAGLMKLGLFAAERRPLRVRLALIGLGIGLPGVAAAAWLLSSPDLNLPRTVISGMLTYSCGPLVSLLYLCTVSLIVDAGLVRGAVRVLASVGRMALTNYLTHTLVCTFIFYHWGLAQFGLWTRPERCALALGLFAAQCIISPLWLRAFRFGPMEWLWRSLTYLKVQPLLRHKPGLTPAL